jgi:PKHD-type hydroxylase
MISEFPYYVFDKELPASFCDGLVTMGLANKQNSGGLHEKDGTFFDPDVRESSISWLNNSELSEILQLYAQKANEAANWNFHVMCFETPQFSTYSQVGQYDWHMDVGVESEDDLVIRKLTLCVSLNDSFEGGDFQIQRWCTPDANSRYNTVKEMRNKGSILVFPSFMFHRVTPVTKGQRYSLACWFRGPDFE